MFNLGSEGPGISPTIIMLSLLNLIERGWFIIAK